MIYSRLHYKFLFIYLQVFIYPLLAKKKIYINEITRNWILFEM